ncbi:hypothetical protein [Pararhizobium sp. DWP1-1-3]|uniref:hypothetical protein n=1 Tax=Pararhizobium sp. DWP1-1-3 TaxID=2804652 RepID=UPI003CE9DCAE
MDKQSNSTTAPEASIGELSAAIVERLRASVANPPIDDAVMTIARALGAAEKRRDYAEGKARHPNYNIKETYKGDEEHASDLTYTLREMLSHLPAESLDGAAVQTAELISLVDLLWDGIPEDAIDYRMKKMHRSIERLLFSVLGCLNGKLSEPVENFVYPDFTNRHMNPWTPIGDRFALRGMGEEASS